MAGEAEYPRSPSPVLRLGPSEDTAPLGAAYHEGCTVRIPGALQW